MIAFEWPFLHRAVAEMDELRIARWWEARTPRNQPAPRSEKDGCEAIHDTTTERN